MSKKVGVVLAGCGYLDGSEIHEATLTLLALDQAGADIVIMAPDVSQMHVVDHKTSHPTESEKRKVLTESSRIARGEITKLDAVKAEELDALIIPGGFGAAKNLSNFAIDGPNMVVNTDLQDLIRNMQTANKPLGFICIAPTIGAKVLGELNPKLTIGNDPGTASALEKMGATHVDCEVDNIVIDENLKIVSTPAYMVGPSIAPVARGITKLVKQIIEMA